MCDLSPEIVEVLLALGQIGDGQSVKRDTLLAKLKPLDRVNRLGCDAWYPVAERLPEDKLKYLVRGLTIAEMELDWYGGSVAGVIWVFRNYESRFPKESNELADWVLARSENPFVPFGRMRGSVRSVAEYHAHLAAKSRRQEEGKQERENAQRYKKIRAEVRRRLEHERRILQEAHNRARNELIAQLKDLSPEERLEHITWDDFHPLSFYPANFADVESHALQRLDRETRGRLLDKLAVRRTGTWRELLKKLNAESHRAAPTPNARRMR